MSDLMDWPNQQAVRADGSGPGVDTPEPEPEPQPSDEPTPEPPPTEPPPEPPPPECTR
jgi:hypothetical protein